MSRLRSSPPPPVANPVPSLQAHDRVYPSKTIDMDSVLTQIAIRENITSPDKSEFVAPIRYAYDYFSLNTFLRPPTLRLNELIQDQTFLRLAAAKGSSNIADLERQHREHSIDLEPSSCGLPYPSGIHVCRQSKHWQVAFDVQKRYVEAFASSPLTQVSSRSGKSIPEIARKTLESHFEDGWSRFAMYLFPNGDEQMTRLVAILTMYAFVLDDFWEMHDRNHFSGVLEYVVSRLKMERTPKEPTDAIERLTDEFVSEVLAVDDKRGGGHGREMLGLLVAFLERGYPAQTYQGLEDYLLYRHEDVGVDPFVAGAKFSLHIDADIASPRLTEYFRLLSRHLALCNDIASYEKERRGFEAGDVLQFSNAVHVIRQLLNLTSEAALAVTLSLQYQTEVELDEELTRMVEEDQLSGEEWRLVDASFCLITGNIMSSVVLRRYGGEKYRLQ